MGAHDAAVRAALQIDRELGRLFGRLGTVEHPNGQVLTAYRNARRALASVIDGPMAAGAAMEILAQLRAEVERAARAALDAAIRAGSANAATQLDIYGLPAAQSTHDGAAELAAWLAVVDGQIAAVRAAVLTDADEALILGDGSQPGMLNPNPVNRDGAKWLAVALAAAWVGTVANGTRSQQDEYRKQVVAAIDERTTECCLMAHGQVRRWETDFVLQGEPRFADHLPWTPFHWYCRSSVVLVRAQDAEDRLTQEMVDAAGAELHARATTGMRVEIHPAHARSRRG